MEYHKIKADNGMLKAWINDVQTVNYEDGGLTKGYIAIQAGESGDIRFRNVKIRPLSN